MARASARASSSRDLDAHLRHSVDGSESHARVNDQMCEKRAHYSNSRKRVAALLDRDAFEWCMGLVIIFNVAILIMETDESGECTHSKGTRCDGTLWLTWVSNALLCLFNAELFLRVFAYRWDVFSSGWNILDIFVVTAGHVDLLASVAIGGESAVPSMVALRVIRTVRLLRSVRILIAFKELYLLIYGFTSAMVATVWGLLLMVVVLVVWSVLSVELIGPVNARVDHDSEYCDEAFSTVWRAGVLYFQTLVVGDSWGACALPIVEESPLTFVLFVGVLSTVLIGLSSLVLAVIVERASDAQHADVVKRRSSDEVAAKRRLLDMCESMDADKSGKIRLEELLTAYEQNEVLRTEMVIMGIEKDELHAMFKLMDSKHLGDVPYDTFVESLWRVKAKDAQVMLMLVKYHLVQLDARINKHHRDVLQRLEDQESLLRRLPQHSLHAVDMPAVSSHSPPRRVVAPCATEPVPDLDRTWMSEPCAIDWSASDLDREVQKCFVRLGRPMVTRSVSKQSGASPGGRPMRTRSVSKQSGASAVEWKRGQPAASSVLPSPGEHPHLDLPQDMPAPPPHSMRARSPLASPRSAPNSPKSPLNSPKTPSQRAARGSTLPRQPQDSDMDVTPRTHILPSPK